jgi:hypothetical protein
MIYNCSSAYYHPYYQGTPLVYQVVTYPSLLGTHSRMSRISPLSGNQWVGGPNPAMFTKYCNELAIPEQHT